MRRLTDIANFLEGQAAARRVQSLSARSTNTHTHTQTHTLVQEPNKKTTDVYHEHSESDVTRNLHTNIHTHTHTHTPQGRGKIGLRGEGVVGAPFPDPPLLGSCDGALKKVIDGGK